MGQQDVNDSNMRNYSANRPSNNEAASRGGNSIDHPRSSSTQHHVYIPESNPNNVKEHEYRGNSEINSAKRSNSHKMTRKDDRLSNVEKDRLHQLIIRK